MGVRLRYTPITGYVHSVEAVISYAGLRDRVQLEPTRPYEPTSDLARDNPLSTVPTLILDDGTPLYGGPVIYEYLDSLHSNPRLYPATGPDRFRVLRQTWAADGLFDAAVRIIVESWEPADKQRPAATERNWQKIMRVLDTLNHESGHWPSLDGTLDMAQIRSVGAISFLVLKYPIIAEKAQGVPAAFDWRQGRDSLARHYDRLSHLTIFTHALNAAPLT